MSAVDWAGPLHTAPFTTNTAKVCLQQMLWRLTTRWIPDIWQVALRREREMEWCCMLPLPIAPTAGVYRQRAANERRWYVFKYDALEQCCKNSALWPRCPSTSESSKQKACKQPPGGYDTRKTSGLPPSSLCHALPGAGALNNSLTCISVCRHEGFVNAMIAYLQYNVIPAWLCKAAASLHGLNQVFCSHWFSSVLRQSFPDQNFARKPYDRLICRQLLSTSGTHFNHVKLSQPM